MEINVNIKCEDNLTNAIVKFSDALELIAKRGIGNVLYNSELIDCLAEELLSRGVGPASTSKKEEITTQAQAPTVQTQQTPTVQTNQVVEHTIPTTEVTYTKDQLALAATGLVDAGKVEEIRKLLAKFGVPALTSLDKSQYGAFATELRALGAQI